VAHAWSTGASSGGVAYGDAGAMFGHTRGGNDLLTVQSGNPWLVGDAGYMSDRVRGGNEVVTGAELASGDAFDELSGQAIGGNDRVSAEFACGDALNDMSGCSRGGNDVVSGGNLRGDATEMRDSARGGNDRLHATDGQECLLVGDAFRMGEGTTGGHDRLFGGTGNDTLAGDAVNRDAGAVGGRDLFVFRPDNGADTIVDFEQGRDRIDIRALGYDRFGELDIKRDGSGGSIVQFSADDQVTIENVADLVRSDFIFG
jgi:hypothetical protein